MRGAGSRMRKVYRVQVVRVVKDARCEGCRVRDAGYRMQGVGCRMCGETVGCSFKVQVLAVISLNTQLKVHVDLVHIIFPQT